MLNRRKPRSLEGPVREPSSKIVTIPTALTASRVVLASQAAKKLVRGERGAFIATATAALTDMEGSVARGIDFFWPQWGRGTTETGAKLDKWADAAALALIGAGVMLSPKVSRAGKVGTGIVLAQETVKGFWAAREAAAYYRRTGEVLDLPPTRTGKNGMVAKLVAASAVALSTEITSPQIGRVLDGIAVVSGGAGAVLGEQARHQYMRDLHPEQSATPNLALVPEATGTIPIQTVTPPRGML